MDAKLNYLDDEIKIIEQSNLKFKEENENLKRKLMNLNNKIIIFKKKYQNQKKINKSI